MHVALLSIENQAAFHARIEAIQSDTPRRFGTMSPAAMFAHVRQTIAMSLGEVPTHDQSNFITRSPLFIRFMFGVMPWPKGKIKAPPVFFPESVQDFQTEKEALLASVDRFIERAQADPQYRGQSPMLGAQPMHLWQLVHGRHLDHHLHQFGA